MKAKLVPIKSIKTNPKNPRVIRDEKFQKLVKSIQEFPKMLDLRPIVVNKSMMVLGGNQRLKACIEAGLKEVPILIADELTKAEQERFIITDNVNFGDWDFSDLNANWNLESLENWGLDIDFGLDETKIEAKEDDYEIPEEIKTDIVIGDLFEIGNHRLLCGDSTDSDAVAKLMDGEKAEILFTSPPYSDMREYNGNKNLKIENVVNFIQSYSFYANYQIINLGIQRKENEIVQYWDAYIQKAKECGYKFLSWGVWNRESATSIGLQTAFFPIFHEWIFIFGTTKKEINRTIAKKDASIERQKYEKPGTRRSKNGELKISNKGNVSFREVKMGTVVTLKAANTIGKSYHPAIFPVGLPSEYIKAMTDDNDMVVDPFAGSGTTMVASQQLNRKCYGMELDPKYCQVIIDRMLKLDPTLEIKKNGKKYVGIKKTK